LLNHFQSFVPLEEISSLTMLALEQHFALFRLSAQNLKTLNRPTKYFFLLPTLLFFSLAHHNNFLLLNILFKTFFTPYQAPVALNLVRISAQFHLIFSSVT
jgi:hypothetical protein